MRVRSRHRLISMSALLALLPGTAILFPSRSLPAQVPRVWLSETTGYGWSASGDGLVGTNSGTLAVRVRDSVAVGLTVMNSYIPNGTDSLTHPARTIGGVVASLLITGGTESGSLSDRLGETFSVGVGAFNNLTGPYTTGLRPGVQIGSELPMLRTDGFISSDLAGNILLWAIPEPHGHLELTGVFGLEFRIF